MTHKFRSHRPAPDSRRARLGVVSLLEDRTVPCMGDEVMMSAAATSADAAVAAPEAAADQPVAAAGTDTPSSASVAPPLTSQAAAAVNPTPVAVPSRLPTTGTAVDDLDLVPTAADPMANDLTTLG